MQSLRDLNSHSRTIIEVADTRPSGVIIDRLRDAVVDQKIVITSTSIALRVGAEIVEIINYAEANVRYRLTINRPSPSLPSSSLSWASIPAGLTLTTVGDVYTITGIKTPAEWNIIKSPTWTLPSDYGTYPIWFITAELIWYDSSIGEDVRLSWDVYDEDYFYLADLRASSALTASISEIQYANAVLSSTATLLVKSDIYLVARATIACTITKQKGLRATLPAFASIMATATTDFMSVQYTVGAGETVSISLSGVSSVIVYWGDATNNTYTTPGTKTHTYATSGNKKVTVVGTYNGFTNLSPSLKRVFSFPTTGLEVLGGLGTRLLEIPATLPASVRNLGGCFAGLTGTDSSNQFDLATISGWDVSRVTYMASMFSDNGAFNSSLNTWNVGLVTSMSNMFYNSIFNQPLNNWNTQSVQDFSFMFAGKGGNRNAFNQDISMWNVSNATSMSGMFQNSTFNQPLNTWNVGNVVSMNFMFEFNPFFNQSLANWNTINVLYFSNMFQNTTFNQPLNTWNTSNAITMNSMFAGSTGAKTSFNQPLSNWNTGKVISFNNMFQQSVFNQDISMWDTHSAVVNGMNRMFENNTVFDQNISGWCVSNIPTRPTNFDTGTSANWTAGEKPVWGTCP